jgi:hypothetical protein
MEVDRTFSQWSIGNSRIKWSAIFAGWAVGLAVQMVLTLAGLGFGAWAIDLHEPDPVEGVPLGAAVWTGLSMLISAFVGGYMTARLSGTAERADGVYHAVVVWGVNWLVFAWLTTTAMATMIGGVFSVFGTTLQALGQGLSSTASTAVSRAAGNLNLSMDDLRREVESVFQATGKPELQPGEIQRDAGRTVESTRQGEPLSKVSDQALEELRDKLTALDREAAINILVNKFGMSPAQARDVVQSTIGLLGPIQETVRGVKQRSTAVGAEALDRLGMIALWLSGLALVSLAISAVGGLIGTPEESLIESSTRTESYRDIRRAS